jgi:hypothetical protein
MAINKILKFCFFLIVITAFFSCEEMDTIHKNYLNGENIYAGKLDSLEIRPGYKRLELNGLTNFLGNSRNLIVTYENNEEIFKIDDDSGDVISVIIDDLEEKTYELNVRTSDESGNLSVPQSVAGFAVGDIFISNQDPRKMIDFNSNADGTFVNFFGNSDSEHVIFTEINYETESSENFVDTLFYKDNSIKLIDFKPLGKMETTSFIESGRNGIDTISIETLEYTLPNLPYSELSKEIIQLVEMPSDINGEYQNADPKNHLFDGISDWDGDNSKTFFSSPGNIPHHFTIDLGVKTIVRKIKLDMPSIGNDNNPTAIQIWGRENLNFAETAASTEENLTNSGWILLHERDVDGMNVDSDRFIVSSTRSKVRYLRFRVVSTVKNIHSQFTEITVYGQDTDPIIHDNTLFVIPDMPSDNPGNFYGAEPNKYLFDNNALWSGSDKYGYHSGENAVPGHFTIDLGVSTKLRKVKMNFRDPSDYSGNNPTEIEIWGRSNLNDAEILPIFSSSGNNVISEPTSSESLTNAGWKLIKTENINGANVQSHEINIETNELLRFYKIRYKKTVAGSGCQFIEVSFSGNGAIKP